LASLVGGDELVADGVAHGVEEARATVDVAPALIGQALRVGADEEIGFELLVRNLGDVGGPRDMRLAGVAELEFRTLFLAVGAADQQHPRLPSPSARRRRLPPRR